MNELKHLDTPKIPEKQVTNLVTKHFPIAVQAFLQSWTEKNFLCIWEMLDEIEDHQLKKVEETPQTIIPPEFRPHYSMNRSAEERRNNNQNFQRKHYNNTDRNQRFDQRGWSLLGVEEYGETNFEKQTKEE